MLACQNIVSHVLICKMAPLLTVYHSRQRFGGDGDSRHKGGENHILLKYPRWPLQEYREPLAKAVNVVVMCHAKTGALCFGRADVFCTFHHLNRIETAKWQLQQHQQAKTRAMQTLQLPGTHFVRNETSFFKSPSTGLSGPLDCANICTNSPSTSAA